MKIFGLAYLAVVTGLAIASSQFEYRSFKANRDMQVEVARATHTMTPYLKPLTIRGPHHHHRRIKDTPHNRKYWHGRWIIDPGDGYLWSAWWE
jgi:hypothetical protein